MKLQLIDFLIILAYLLTISTLGLILKKRAQSSKGEYLLGGNKLPWYLLGLSNASGMFDISGTMWLVTALFVYGLKSIWLPWLWPVFNQIFLMVYLSAWLRRSNVTTGAEWINHRFGNDFGARLSHMVIVVFAIANSLGFLAYGFIGLGKFMEIFIPWEYVNQFLNLSIDPEFVPHLYGIVFTLFAVFYAVLGGMVSIVLADLIQYTIMTISAIVIAIIAMKALAGNVLDVPEGWMNPFFGKTLDIDWTTKITDVQQKIREDGYQLFTAFFMMMVCKGFLVSAAGPTPTYDMQKILATKSPTDAAKMSGFVSVILMPFRYLMIAGFAVLGILFYDKLDLIVAGNIDYEQVLPSAINEFVPVGLLGLLLAGLLAAFMSTFAGTLNAAQAYITNDLYLKYFNRNANNNQIKISNYLSGIIFVIISIIFGMASKNVNQLLQIIVSALWGGYVAANVIKWYWWRFNSYGFFWGMVFGMIASAVPLIWTGLLEQIFPNSAPDIRFLYFFPAILIFAIIGCIIGTYFYKPTDTEVLKEFYRKVRPWGFWKPIHELVVKENPEFKKNTNFGRDMLNILLGIIGQTAFVVLPIYIVVKQTLPIFVTIAILVVVIFIMKRTWWDKLED
ncbi:MAG: sodium:solute symporter family protein [Bacteroidales bacterium]